MGEEAVGHFLEAVVEVKNSPASVSLGYLASVVSSKISTPEVWPGKPRAPAGPPHSHKTPASRRLRSNLNLVEQSKKSMTPTQPDISFLAKPFYGKWRGGKCLNAGCYSNYASHTFALSLQLTPFRLFFLNLNHVWLCNQIRTFDPLPIWIYRPSATTAASWCC